MIHTSSGHQFDSSDSPDKDLSESETGAAGIHHQGPALARNRIYRYSSGEDDGDPESPRGNHDVELHCFRCGRDDRHYHSLRPRRWFSFLLGLSLGLLNVVGPYRCRCCGGTRLMRYDFLSPRYWLSFLTNSRF